MRTRWHERETWRGETIVYVRERMMGGSVNGDRAEGNADSPGVKGAASCWPWVFPRNVSEDGHGRRATLSITRAGRNATAPRLSGSVCGLSSDKTDRRFQRFLEASLQLEQRASEQPISQQGRQAMVCRSVSLSRVDDGQVSFAFPFVQWLVLVVTV